MCFTKYAIYGPTAPNAFAKMPPIDMPVCRKHVGYVSIDCKLIAKYVIADQNLIIIVKQVAVNFHSLSALTNPQRAKPNQTKRNK